VIAVRRCVYPSQRASIGWEGAQETPDRLRARHRSETQMLSPSSEDNFARTAEFWDAKGQEVRREHWQAHPVVQEWFLRRREGLSSMQALAKHLKTPNGRALGLGVGAASAELELVHMGAVSSYDFYDVAPRLLEAAEQAAAGAGLSDRITCRTADINRIDLPAEHYDLITFVSSLHHVERLEHVLQQCHKALRPGGLFYAQEYVGPNRFAFPADHVSLARQIYRTLDPRLLCGLPELPTPDPLAVADADPTESIRSEEVVNICRRVFPATHVVSDEICLTIIIWYGLNHESVYDTPAGHALVNWVLEADQALVRSGRLPTYQVEIFGRKPMAETAV
jgi:SAM-dependent methyltransferase